MNTKSVFVATNSVFVQTKTELVVSARGLCGESCYLFGQKRGGYADLLYHPQTAVRILRDDAAMALRRWLM